MKYLFIVAHPKHFIGGAEVQAYRIATQLKSKNIDIEYLMSWHKNEDAIYDENNIKINYFKRGGITKILSIINAYRKIKEINPDVIYMRGAPYAWAAGVYYSKQNQK